MPEIKSNYEAEVAPKQVSAFMMPVREDIQMTYHTQDGSTIKVKDLSSAAKFKGDVIPTSSDR